MSGFLWRVLSNVLDLAALVLAVAATLAVAAGVAVVVYQQSGSDVLASCGVAGVIIVGVAIMEEIFI